LIHFNRNIIEKLDKVSRLNLINSITGFKPANLIGTISNHNQENLAIFSSLVHLGSKPPLLGLVTRPDSVPRHTYSNIIESKYYTINHINHYIIERAHMTSAKFDRDESEFEKCDLEKEYIDDFQAPYVKESECKIGMKFIEEIKIKSNNTILIVGEVHNIIIKPNSVEEDGSLDFEKLNSVCISGLDTYYRTKKIIKYPYARKKNIPTKWIR
tara:strand:- start:16087 stop:16725 length:639 start_codon:yes stop_codon:yes gene_type:complete